MEDEDSDGAEGWAGARRREDVVADLIRRYPKRLTAGAIDGSAWELGSSRATVYRLVRDYRSTRTVTGPMAQMRGRKNGSRFLEKEREALIREAIEQDYLKPTRPPFSRLVEHIRSRYRQ